MALPSIRDRFAANKKIQAANLANDFDASGGGKKFEADDRFLPRMHDKGKKALTITALSLSSRKRSRNSL